MLCVIWHNVLTLNSLTSIINKNAVAATSKKQWRNKKTVPGQMPGAAENFLAYEKILKSVLSDS